MGLPETGALRTKPALLPALRGPAGYALPRRPPRFSHANPLWSRLALINLSLQQAFAHARDSVSQYQGLPIRCELKPHFSGVGSVPGCHAHPQCPGTCFSSPLYFRLGISQEGQEVFP